MDMKEATKIVVGMAQSRPEDSDEGQALRMILRDLREERQFMIGTGDSVARMEMMLQGVQ